MSRKTASAVPEWSRKILAFRNTRKLTQSGLAKELNTSGMAVSRWERGEAEPSGHVTPPLPALDDQYSIWAQYERVREYSVFAVCPQKQTSARFLWIRGHKMVSITCEHQEVSLARQCDICAPSQILNLVGFLSYVCWHE